MTVSLSEAYEIGPDHPIFEQLRARLKDPPKRLFGRGAFAALGPAVAIVGTRYADSESLDFTVALARDLASAGCCIVSGGASGVDTAAHRGALLSQGVTVVVLGTPLDRAYPSCNRALFDRIVMSGGALLTEQPQGTVVHPGMFIRRNRLIAGLASAVIVVRAPAKSGALSTARYAQKLEIPLYYVPAPPWDPRGAGCLWLARQGAGICTSVQDVLSHAAFHGLKPRGHQAQRTQQANVISRHISELDEDGRAILGQLAKGNRFVEQLAAELRFSAKRVQRALVMLCLSHHVLETDAGQYGLVPQSGTKG